MLFLAGCSRAPKIERVEWPVMSTVAAVQSRGRTGVDRDFSETTAAVKAVFAEVEKLLNAYDRESELSRLSALSDEDVIAKCDPRVRPCYEAAFRLRDETGGVFNPRYRGPGTMDLGAIAKGYAVDLATAKAGNEGDLLIDLGGNLRAVSGSWKVGVLGGDSFELKAGEACATSARYFRGDHIKDGRTGETVSNAVHSVTVIHPSSAMLADALSTVMFLLGREKGEEFLKHHYPEAKACWIFKE